MTQKLTAYIPAHNEEKHLDACLSCLHFADEILVQLDKCTDSTKDIALKHGAKIIEGAWDKEPTRRTAGLEACSGDWILEIDADERVPEELGREIRQVIETSPHGLHCLWIDNHIGNKLVLWGWGAYMGVMQKVILFKKGAKTYHGNRVTYAEVTYHGTFGPVLENRLIHYTDDSLSDTIRRFNKYTEDRKIDLIESGNIETFGRNVRRLFSRFYKAYIRRKGYKEGSIGLFIGILAALYPMVSYIKAKYKI